FVDGVDPYEQLGNTTGVNIFNTTAPPLDDVRVRKALALAIERDDVIEVLGGTGLVPPSSQPFGQDDPYFSEAVDEAWQDGDPETARALLEPYVHDPNRSDGQA